MEKIALLIMVIAGAAIFLATVGAALALDDDDNS